MAGFADGAVKAYDRRIRDAESTVRTYREHSSWIVGARCQKNSSKDLVTARFFFFFCAPFFAAIYFIILFSIDGEIHLWDSRYATRSIMDWHMHDRLATFDLHNQTGVFAA